MNTKVMFSSKIPEWSTPQEFYNKLDREFKFTLDPCCTKENAKCKKYYTIKENGLTESWKNEIVFMNPPYGKEIKDWVEKASWEARLYNAFVVALLPARTDTRWFHNNIYYYDGKDPNREIRFIKGRLKFGESKNSAPFPSMIVIFK